MFSRLSLNICVSTVVKVHCQVCDKHDSALCRPLNISKYNKRGAKFFPFRVNPFKKGDRTILTELRPVEVD